MCIGLIMATAILFMCVTSVKGDDIPDP